MTEAFPFLNPINTLPGIRAGWVGRVPDLTITGDRDEAMRLLRPGHQAALACFAPGSRVWRAEQIHDNKVAVVPAAHETTAPDGLPVIPGADGLVTNQTGNTLVIYVADCGPIWLADAATGAIGLLHSGKKGTELDILSRGLDTMARHFGTRPENVTAVLGPCIRPPDYETDFAAEIARQADRAGLANFTDCQLNTASDLDANYSYRTELGKTGRMMAMIIRDTTP